MIRRLALLLTAAALTAAFFVLPANAASDLVLCAGHTYTGWTKAPIKLDPSKDARLADPAVRKVIRGCTFEHSARSKRTQPAILVLGVRNLLIPNSVFRDIRGVAGNGVHAIAIKGALVSDGVTIEGSTFEDIGADGIQAGDSGPLVTNLHITNGNTFTAPASGGENAIDIKGTLGPTLIADNEVSGYRPCDGDVSDCSGSQGAGIVIHDSSTGARPQDVTITRNRIHDNERGVTLAQVDNATVAGNEFCANAEDVVFGADNGAYTVAGNTDCASPSQTPASPSPSPSASPTPAPTPSPSPAPTPAPTRRPWWGRWFPWLR